MENYEFTNAPAYSEKLGRCFHKNGSGSTNSFDGEPDLALTAGGVGGECCGGWSLCMLVGLHYRHPPSGIQSGTGIFSLGHGKCKLEIPSLSLS